MKILLDECIPVVMLEHLKSKNLDATHVKEPPWAGSSNSDLYKKAQGKYQILITTDRHFTHPEKFKPLPDFGVIYLRVVPTVGPLLVQALDFFLSKNTLETIIGKLTIVRRND